MSSKYSAKEKLSRKLEDSIESRLRESINDKDDLNAEEIKSLPNDLFEISGYDEKESERSGYSNYSYWRSTIRMFFKNKVAVAMLVIMLVLLIFTFIQPILPNQFDANTVNYYEKAVWVKVDEEAKTTYDSIKWTKGDYPVSETGEGTLTYIKTPSSWGTPKVTAQSSGAKETMDVAVTADPNNKGWFYCFVSSDEPYIIIYSEDGTKKTYQEAVWVQVDESGAVTYGSTKLTDGDLIANEDPDNYVLTYFNAPDEWGIPQVHAASIQRGDEGIDLELIPDPDNSGWYYALVPVESMMLTIKSEDGATEAANMGVARITDPLEVKPIIGFIGNLKPNAVFWFGTNDIGQDLWARMWNGTRTSLFIGIVVALIEAVVGIIVGLLWGYVRKLDFLLTEIYNIINNIPSTIILILASYIMRPSISTIIIAMSITGWIGLARFIRNQVIIIRDRDFNLASRCLGTPTRRVIVKNLLPQMVSVVMLRMALAIPGAIGSEVFLAYIGLGLPINIPSLGNLVNKGRTLMMAPSLRYQLFIPAIILSVITVCFYLVGNAFSDASDPKNHV